MNKNMDGLKDPTLEAAERREAVRKAIEGSHDVFDNPGIELNQRYVSDAAVTGGASMPDYTVDPELFYEPTSFPGARLPHAWVARDGHRESILYLCGQGKFTLLTGPSGEGWREAAKAAEKTFGVPITVHVIGPGQEYEDMYHDFARMRETRDDGALLVRPDVYVGWRADSFGDNATQDLLAALGQILGRDPAKQTGDASTEEEKWQGFGEKVF